MTQPEPPKNTSSSNKSKKPRQRQELWQVVQVWREFQQALYSTRQDSTTFNGLVWTLRFGKAALEDVSYSLFGIQVEEFIRSIVPVLAIVLIVVIILAYFGVARSKILPNEWCHHERTTFLYYCHWIYVHDVIASYISGMILFYWYRLRYGPSSEYKNPSTTMAPSSTPTYHPAVLTATATPNTSTCDTDTRFYPDPSPSYCHTCQHTRPPRCHHCKVCQACILTFDHHCIWLGRCIGQENHRSFVAFLLFLTAGCMYGVLLLWKPFYRPLQEQLQEILLKNQQQNVSWVNVLSAISSSSSKMLWGNHLQMSWKELVDQIFACGGTYEQEQQQECTQMLIDVVYPFLCGVGCILAIFTGQHIKYMINAQTTLEHSVLLQRELDQLLVKQEPGWIKQRIVQIYFSALIGSHRNSNSNNNATNRVYSKSPPQNLFDQGRYRNLQQSLGTPMWYVLLPIPMTATRPFQPSNTLSMKTILPNETSYAENSTSFPGTDSSSPSTLSVTTSMTCSSSSSSTDRSPTIADILSSSTTVMSSTEEMTRERYIKKDVSLGTDAIMNRSSGKDQQLALSSKIGLDVLLKQRSIVGALSQGMVQIETGEQGRFGYTVDKNTVLGSGLTGTVRQGIRSNGVKYAVKIIDLDLVDELGMIQDEIFCWCQLDHPNIVSLNAISERSNEIHLIQEHCSGGDLFERLMETEDCQFPEALCVRLSRQLLSAVGYMHSKGIMHRDLKLENIMLSDRTERAQLKIIDFGFSKRFFPGEYHSEPIGTPYTAAPEVLRHCYDERCDIWSVGVLVFMFLSGEPPFGGCGGPESLLEIRNNILQCDFAFDPEAWEPTSYLSRSFVSQLLVTNPTERLSIQQAFRHPWIVRHGVDGNGERGPLGASTVDALIKYKDLSVMRQVLHRAISFVLPPHKIVFLQDEFDKLDLDGTGAVSADTFREVFTLSVLHHFTSKGGEPSSSQAVEVTDAICGYKLDPRVEWHDFISAVLTECVVDESHIVQAFRILDVDGKGNITISDIVLAAGNGHPLVEKAVQDAWVAEMTELKTELSFIEFRQLLAEDFQYLSS